MTPYTDYAERVSAGAPTVRTGSRLPGLERRTLGPVQVFAQSVSGAAPAAAMATTPAIAAGTAGNGVGWSFVAATAVALLIAGCIGQFTRRMAAAGSLYSLAAKGLGPVGAFACGYALLIGYGLLVSASLAGSAGYLLELAARLGLPVPSPVAAGAVVLLGCAAAAFAIRGIRLSARVVLLVEGVSIALMLVVFGLLVGGGGVDWPAAATDGDPSAAVAGVLPALSAFIGFEAAASLGVEARHPFRTIPRAVRWTAAGAGVMYVCAAAVQVAGFAGLPGSLAGQQDPLTALASAQHVPWVPPLLDAGLAASFLACALATANSLVRVVFSMGTEGVAPRRLRRTHRTYRTPHLAVAVALPLVTAPPAILAGLGIPLRRALELLVQASTVGYLVAYLLVCLAVPFFLRSIGESTPGAVTAAAVTVPVLAAAVVTFTATMADGGLGVTLAALTTVGVLWYGVLRVRRPGRLARIGVYDETSLADVLGGPDPESGAKGSRETPHTDHPDPGSAPEDPA